MGPPVPGIRSAHQGPHVGAGPDRSFSTFAPNSLPVPRRLVNVHSSPQGTDFTARYAAIGNVRAPGSVSVPVTSPCVPLSLRPFAALVPSYSLPITLRRWALFGCTVAMEENSSVVPWGPMTRRLITAPARSPTRVSITASSRSPSPPGAARLPGRCPAAPVSGAGAHGLSGPSSTCAAMRRGLHTIPPRALHCPLLPRDGAAVFRWSRPLLGTPAGQLRHPTPSRAAVGAAVSRPGRRPSAPGAARVQPLRPATPRLGATSPAGTAAPALSPSDKATPRAPHLHVPSPPSLSGGPGHSPARGRGCSRAPRPLVPRAVQEADFGTGLTSPSPEGHSLA
ncbi:hypothetical protein NDU88_007383 [Pleurodeles waltl]|uniref:Uncharacterized protein n=1 Tax=Pleurodeles waltl TaxID=8319 RepID=A0AAV7UNN1_PLEWA|nr:hypothetical protein NDU88_007383 [Pleurodeles waltl]